MPAPDSAADAPRPPVAVRFMVEAEASPGLLLRLLHPFARRDLTPERMWSHCAGETMHVEIAHPTIPAAEVHLITGNLRQVVGVRQVTEVRPNAVRAVA